MYESAADVQELQELLDRTYADAGEHLRGITTPERRMSAEETIEFLQGMCLLALATVTADGRPLVGPVDGHFYKGQFWFGSSPTSVRYRHIQARPYVSATHTPAESHSVTVHGTAGLVDVNLPEHAEFREHCVALYGEEWLNWGAGAFYARIHAEKMFTFRVIEGG